MSEKKVQKYQQNGNNRVTDSSTTKPARLTLRDGVWYADGVPCAKFSAALKTTLRAAGLASAPPEKGKRPKRKPNPPPHPYPKPERLETRAWWPEFLRIRAARIEAERAAEQGERDRAEAAIWAAIRRTGAEPPIFTKYVGQVFTKYVGHARPTFQDPPKSLTLRERFLAKAVGA